MRRMLACVALCCLILAAAGSGAWGAGCDCEETWWATANAAHSGCRADEIHAGSVSADVEAVYRWHEGHFSKTADSDTDCHKKTDCSYEDVSESSFVCTWTLQKLVGLNWEDSTEGALVDTSATGATFADTESCEPDCMFRARVLIDDTPGDGPDGDDGPDERYSTTITVMAPAVTNFRQGAAPTMDGNGTVTETYLWDSTCCGDVAHLDKVKMREYLTFENDPFWNSGGNHYFFHALQNFWQANQVKQNPYFSAANGASGGMVDTHTKPAARAGTPNTSVCEGGQRYEWKTGWPDQPEQASGGTADPDWPIDTGTVVGTYTFQRRIDQDGGVWKYNWHKGDGDPLWHTGL